MTVINRGRGAKPRWYYYFNIRGARYQSSIPEARTKAEAVEAENAERRKVFEGTYGSARLGSKLFTEFVKETYLPWAETNKRSWRDDKWVATILDETFRGKKLCEVSPLMIEKLKRDLKDTKTKRDTPRAASSVNMVLSILSRIFTLAIDMDQAATNPVRKVKKLSVSNQQFRYLSWDEETRLIQALVNPAVKAIRSVNGHQSHSNNGRHVLHLSSPSQTPNAEQRQSLQLEAEAPASLPAVAQFGKRRSTVRSPGGNSDRQMLERVKLKAAQRAHLRDAIPLAIGTGLRRSEQTRLQAKHCDFARNVIVVEHTNINPTKTNRLREVPMNDDVRAILRRRSHGKRPDEFLFVNPTTKRPYLDFKNGFGAACAEAGIQGLTWKALRHTFGTRLGEAGHNAFDIADLMGHTDIRTSMRYVHSTDRRKHEAVQSTMLSRRATA